MFSTPFRSSAAAFDAVQGHAVPLARGAEHDGALIDLLAGARFALLGEASHGTHEFYRERAAITRRLIVEQGFNAVAVEADWPDAYRVNRYVRGARRRRATATEALGDFKRFPTWMWRNTDVLDFVDWLREHNAGARAEARVGFYGLDLYSLFTSIEAVLALPRPHDPEAAHRARDRYACFEHFGGDSQAYGYAARFGLDASPASRRSSRSCSSCARTAAPYRAARGDGAEDATFHAEQNARLVQERRGVLPLDVQLAGLVVEPARPPHGRDARRARSRHLARRRDGRRGSPSGRTTRTWATRARPRWAKRGELNLGQLVRERHGAAAVLVGFSTHHGTVTAASDWDAPAERSRSGPALAGSYEALFHGSAAPRFRLILRGNATLAERARGAAPASARSASSTGPRPSARATTSTPACRASSTR